MKQAIKTKYLPFTNTLPARIKASCFRGSLVLSVHSEKMIQSIARNDEQNHIIAAKELIKKFIAEDEGRHGKGSSSWTLNISTGLLPDGNCVHVATQLNETQLLTIKNVADVADITNNMRPHDMATHTQQVINSARVTFGLK